MNHETLELVDKYLDKAKEERDSLAVREEYIRLARHLYENPPVEKESPSDILMENIIRQLRRWSKTARFSGQKEAGVVLNLTSDLLEANETNWPTIDGLS